MTDSHDNPAKATDHAAKKPYKPPKLEVYGDLRKITNTVNNRGSIDGGVPLMHKTR